MIKTKKMNSHMKKIHMGNFEIGGSEPFVLIAGPCVIEDEVQTRNIAVFLKDLTEKLEIPFIFKASYDKANRTSKDSFRGPGIKEGLNIIKRIKKELGIPTLSDVHRFEEIDMAAEVLDVVQVPAFLCRQTDFVMEIAQKARIINIKKGQFLAPMDVEHVLSKASATGNNNIMITERGTSFGYNNLVVDFRGFPLVRNMGHPVIFDATHSVQLPGGAGTISAGERDMVSYLSRAAVAVGVDGIFFEVHPDPEKARCDGANSLCLDSLEAILRILKKIDNITKREVLESEGVL
jgi:2-dehydro-3-deoxyphosphooctonate aldolase (KDO 8-P synthase)